MKVSVHVASTGILSLIILATTNWQSALLFFVGGVGIDVDHYLNYAVREKDWSLIRAYKWHLKILKQIRANPEKYLVFHVFHSVEFILIVLIISYFLSNYFLLLGIGFHSLLDIIEAFRYKAMGIRRLSFIQYIFMKPEAKKDKIVF